VTLVTTPIAIMVVDDQALMRQALTNFFDAEPDFTVTSTACDGAEAAQLCESEPPDVVMMDLQMPGTNGVEGTRRIVALPDPPKVVALTNFSSIDWVVSALQAGASGYMVKDTDPDVILESVRKVLSDDIALSPMVSQMLAERVSRESPQSRNPEQMRDEAEKNGLSEREHEVLTLLGRGLNNKEIAEELFLSEGSIKMHLSKACDRLNARDRVQLLIRGVELGIVEPQIQNPETAQDRRYM
jgi:DNA-binding NarL/FixJ family response regulator